MRAARTDAGRDFSNHGIVAGSGDSERTLSPKTLKPTIGERVVRCKSFPRGTFVVLLIIDYPPP